MANLTLVSSACDVVSTVYASTKDSHPYVRSVCDAAEKGVRSVTEATASCVQPVLTSLEPHGNPLSKGGSAPACEGFSGSFQPWKESWDVEMHLYHHTEMTIPGLQVKLKRGALV